MQKFIKNPYHVLSLIYFCVGLGSPKAALDVVNNELYCFLSCGGSSSGWWPGNAVGSLAKMKKKKIIFLKYSFDHEFELNLTSWSRICFECDNEISATHDKEGYKHSWLVHSLPCERPQVPSSGVTKNPYYNFFPFHGASSRFKYQ